MRLVNLFKKLICKRDNHKNFARLNFEHETSKVNNEQNNINLESLLKKKDTEEDTHEWNEKTTLIVRDSTISCVDEYCLSNKDRKVEVQPFPG